MLHERLQISSLVPRPLPAFQRSRKNFFSWTLKSWEWPGDEANKFPDSRNEENSGLISTVLQLVIDTLIAIFNLLVEASYVSLPNLAFITTQMLIITIHLGSDTPLF